MAGSKKKIIKKIYFLKFLGKVVIAMQIVHVPIKCKNHKPQYAKCQAIQVRLKTS